MLISTIHLSSRCRRRHRRRRRRRRELTGRRCCRRCCCSCLVRQERHPFSPVPAFALRELFMFWGRKVKH